MRMGVRHMTNNRPDRLRLLAMPDRRRRDIVLQAGGGWSYKLAASGLLALASLAAGARADDPGPRMFSFSGFGTLGVVNSSQRNADYTSSAFKPNGAGYSHDWSADVDSLIGAQLDARFTPKLSAVLQVISQQNYDNTYWPHVEWANIKYQVTSDFSIRVGRIVLPVFFVSDYLKVGYANPWVRPPVGVYSLVPVTYADGVDVSYRMRLGEATNIVQSNYGTSDNQLPAVGDVKARQAFGVSDTIEFGNLSARFSYQQAKLTLNSFNSLFDAYRSLGPSGVALAERDNADGKILQLFGAGASYDPGKWFVMGEVVASIPHFVTRKQRAGYFTGGYRLGKFTPYLTYSQVLADKHSSDPGVTLPGAAGLNAGLDKILQSAPIQHTESAGVRWDFMRNTALKVQYDYTRLGAGSPGVLINLQPEFQPGGHFETFSVAVVFVF
jgi:opacity protein-like surface antigen